MIPFSKVTLNSWSSPVQYNVLNGNPAPSRISAPDYTAFPGSAMGLGDVVLALKGNVVNGEHVKMALGTEVRMPTGDETNYLGTGAYGFKPYFVLSRTGRRITPNVNIGYQWNGTSSLYVAPNSSGTLTKQNLPSSFLYSGGLDWRVHRKLTLTGEFLGQLVINGPRVQLTNAPDGIQLLSDPNNLGSSLTAPKTVANAPNSTYAMDNIGFGFKYSPFKTFQITANLLIKLDDGGLRANYVPLIGIAYRFGK